MPHVVIGTDKAIVCHREVPAEEALEHARTASAEFPEAMDVWLFESLSEAPWHASLTPVRRKGSRSL